MPLMVSISGIRGIIGESLTPAVAVRYSAAFAHYCNRGTIAVGRDGRITGAAVEQIVISTLVQMGCDVISLGICPTPTVALAIEQLGCAGGIAVTASHNPMQWNGLKFMGQTGLFLNAEENNAFWTIADNNSFQFVPWDTIGSVRNDPDFLTKHIDAVLKIAELDKEKIRSRKFRIVLDCVNAAGGKIVPELLRRLGCAVTEMNCDVSGIFSHTPEPIPENLTSLAARVVSEKADLGIAVDPDVDRLVLINERGEPFVEEYTIASAVRFVLGAEARKGIHNHTVVVNLSTTRAVEDIASIYGATVVRTPVGEINVASKMKAVNSVIGGEGSGGVIFPAVHAGRDAIVGIALFLQLLADSGESASALKASMPQYTIVKGKIDIGDLQPDALLASLHDRYSKNEKTNNDDGLKIDFQTSWVHLRKSNTEPIIRIIAEAKTEAEAQALVSRFTKEIRP